MSALVPYVPPSGAAACSVCTRAAFFQACVEWQGGNGLIRPEHVMIRREGRRPCGT